MTSVIRFQDILPLTSKSQVYSKKKKKIYIYIYNNNNNKFKVLENLHSSTNLFKKDITRPYILVQIRTTFMNVMRKIKGIVTSILCNFSIFLQSSCYSSSNFRISIWKVNELNGDLIVLRRIILWITRWVNELIEFWKLERILR